MNKKLSTHSIHGYVKEVASPPFIIRNTTADNSTEALSLSAATWSLATIFSGLIISGLDWISFLNISKWTISFNEQGILWIITFIGMGAIRFVAKMKEDDPQEDDKRVDIYPLGIIT